MTKRRKKKHFQLLTEEYDEPHLDDLIKSTITLLRACPNGQWKFFEMLYRQAYQQAQGDLFIADEMDRLMDAK